MTYCMMGGHSFALSASRFKRLHSLTILSWIARWAFTTCLPFRHSRTPVPQKGHTTMSLQTWCRGQDAGIQYPMKYSGFKYLSDILKQQQWKCSAVIKYICEYHGNLSKLFQIRALIYRHILQFLFYFTCGFRAPSHQFEQECNSYSNSYTPIQTEWRKPMLRVVV